MNISERVREERAVRQRNAEISLGRRQELPRTVTDADLEEAAQLFTHYPGDVHESLRLAIDFALRQGTAAPASVSEVSEPSDAVSVARLQRELIDLVRAALKLSETNGSAFARIHVANMADLMEEYDAAIASTSGESGK